MEAEAGRGRELDIAAGKAGESDLVFGLNAEIL